MLDSVAIKLKAEGQRMRGVLMYCAVSFFCEIITCYTVNTCTARFSMFIMFLSNVHLWLCLLGAFHVIGKH